MGSQNDPPGLEILRTKWKFENRLDDDCNIQTAPPDDAENQAVWAARGGGATDFDASSPCIFRCYEAPLYVGLSVRLSVHPSVCPLVRRSVKPSFDGEKRCFVAPYAVYPALFHF